MPLLGYIIFWAAIAIFVFVQSLLVADAIRSRRNGRQALEIVWTVVPVTILIVLGFFAYQVLREG